MKFPVGRLCGLEVLDGGLLGILGHEDTSDKMKNPEHGKNAPISTLSRKKQSYALSFVWKRGSSTASPAKQKKAPPAGEHADVWWDENNAGARTQQQSRNHYSSGGGRWGEEAFYQSSPMLEEVLEEQKALRWEVAEVRENIAGLQQIVLELADEVRQILHPPRERNHYSAQQPGRRAGAATRERRTSESVWR